MGLLEQIAGRELTKPAANKLKKEKDFTSLTTGGGVPGVTSGLVGSAMT